MQCHVRLKHLAVGCALLAALVVSQAGVQAQAADKTTARYTATTANLGAASGETITIELSRWSTDAERNIAATAFDAGEARLLEALHEAPSLGYIWRSGSGLGIFVRYAHKYTAADGEHVVLITDSDLRTWKGVITEPTEPSFTLIEIVTGSSGDGTGKLSLGNTIVQDAANQTLRLEDYAAAQVSFRMVKHQPVTAER